MKKLIGYLICALTIIGISALAATGDPIIELLKKLEEFTKKYPTEKVYIHLDKPYYAIGDNIWFKAYIIDTRTAAPTTISNILYVELINDKDSVAKLLKLPMMGGTTAGDFKLTDSLTEGNYRIRAYTQWMRNAGPNFFFDKTIKIGNGLSNKVFTKATYQLKTVNNSTQVTSTIQFTDKNGKPYVKTPINYDIQINAKSVAKNKGTTNADGEIILSFLNNQAAIANTGKIIATLTFPDGSKVKKVIPIKTTIVNTDVQFLPEGGNLVIGLPCKIAIKAINGSGLGENVSGIILDNQGSEVLNFETSYLGMGVFSLNPEAGKTYTAKIKLESGAIKLVELPKAQTSGYTLSINNTDTTKMNIKVMLSPDLLNQGELNLVAHHNGNVLFTTQVSTVKQVANVVVPKNEFPSGITQITLFSPTNLPICERIVFINNVSDKINLTIENLKPIYTTRGSVALNVLASNSSKLVQGSFSVAITNADTVVPDMENETNILTSLLLTSDLIGYIEKPNHYFLTNDLKTLTELDNLLLTQGWRKIDWSAIANAQAPKAIYEAEKSMKISGWITTNSGKPIPNGKVSLFSTSRGMFAVDTVADAKGYFNFNEISFTDSVKFVVQARTPKNKKDVNIKLDLVPAQAITRNQNTGDIEVNVNSEMANYLKQSDNFFDEQYKKGFLTRTNLLKQVEITAKKNPAKNSKNLNGAGRADMVITGEELKNSFSVSMYLRNRVMGMTVDKDGYPMATGRGTPGRMGVVLDGMVLKDYSLDDIVVDDVESIEILKNVAYTTIYGSDGSSGLVVITTKSGNGLQRSMSSIYAPGIILYYPKGYDVTRKFYSPRYDVTPDSRPDLRTTVYWDAHVITDANGKAVINYYNTDQKGNYRMVIEGIDAAGNLARKTYNYKVN